MDREELTGMVEPQIRSTRSLHDWMLELSKEHQLSKEDTADAFEGALQDAMENVTVEGRGFEDIPSPPAELSSLVLALARIGLAAIDLDYIASYYCNAIESNYLASTDDYHMQDEVEAAAESVFGESVVEVTFDREWMVVVDEGDQDATWRMVDAIPGTTSVTSSVTGRVHRVDFERVD